LGSGTRAQNVAQTSQARASGLQDRMTAGERQGQRQVARGERQGQRQDTRGQLQQGRQANRSGAREDWQNWANQQHGDWYHGAWSGGWYPGATFANYPVAAALGVTTWGLNRMSNAFGMVGYENPYYGESGGGYDYSEPIAAYEPAAEQPATADATATAPAQPAANQEAMTLFDQAREAFARGDYQQALELCDQTLKAMPNDAVVHEFRSLTQFALQNYREAAAGAYAVLSAGPGWDWTTLSSLYGNVADYTAQLRALEAFVKKNPKSSDGHFLLAYHYLTAGNADAANAQLREVDKLTPKDRLVTQLLSLTSKSDDKAAQPAPPEAIPDDKLIKAEQLVGVWTAGGSGGSNFQMTLEKDSAFSWKFTSGKKSDEIKGVFAVEQNNLALEVDDGSVMLAEIALTGNQLKFKVIDSEASDPGLTFMKGK
jgi:tetratricopeptide (TPR) repeat protein